MASSQCQVDALRHAVASTSTCTSATVVSLKSILLAPRDAEPKPQAATSKSATASTSSRAAQSRAASTTSSSRPATAASRRRPASARDDPRQDGHPALSDKEKAQLATHVINAALKSLTEASKPAAAAPPKTPSTSRVHQLAAGDEMPPPSKPTSRAGLRRSNSTPLTPLQPRTLNRVSTSPIKSVHQPAALSHSSTVSNNHTACLATVECARVAFLTLRTIQDAGHVALPELQLEAGMSSFVTKLIGLHMLDHACRELHILKRRLQGALSPSSSASADAARPAATTKTSRTVKATKPAARAPTKATAASSGTSTSLDPHSSSSPSDLFDFGDVTGAPAPTLRLIVASQLQALRILAALKKPSHIEASLPFLRRSCKSSPLQLLIGSVKASGGSQAEQQKTLRQLETLSQLLLALTPSISSKDDAASLEPKLNISPLAALELQMLSLETRLRYWIMSNQSKADADKEILSPLARCLSTYARRSRAAGKALSWTSCRSRFDHIYELLQTGQYTFARTSKSPLATIYQTLSTVARDTGQLDEAIHFSTEICSLLNANEDSAARRSSASAQLLSLQLKNPSKYLAEARKLLTEVLEAIRGSLKGDTLELEELLGNVCLVRKAAVSLLISQMGHNKRTNPATDEAKGGSSKQPSSMTQLLEAFIYQCPRFCLRWLGKPPAAKSSTKDFLRYEQRRQLLSQSIRHTLDSAFVVTKTMIEEDRMVWDQLDSVLGDSLTVLEYLGSDVRTIDAASSYHVKISHFYYLSYNALRRGGRTQADSDHRAANTEALKSLRRSIDSVKHRPAPEKERAQLIPKLERMADLCKSVGQVGEALGALQTIRGSLVDDNVLANVASLLSSQPPRLAWTASDPVETLSRTLVSISRLEQVHVDWTAGLEEMEQAAILEHQLYFILLGANHSSSNKNSPPPRLTLAHPCVEALLRIYYPTQFPIRRLRTLLRLFSANIDTPDVLADIAPQIQAALGLIENQGLGDDTTLARHLPHYKTLATSLTGFSEGYPDSGVIESCLSAWKALLADKSTVADLDKVMDSASDLHIHLQSVAEFLRAMGRDSYLTRVLELTSDLCKVLSGTTDDGDAGDAGQLVLCNNSMLASHYVRMGDCLQAEKILEQLNTSLKRHDSGFSMEAVTSFHLSYAEYFIAIGRHDEATHHLIEAKPDSTSYTENKLDGSHRRRLGARASLLHSFVALEKGDAYSALQNARQGVRTLFHDWDRLEKAMALSDQTDTLPTGQEASTDEATEQSVDLGASLREAAEPSLVADSSVASTTTTAATAASPEFWTLFHPLFNSMLRLSFIYAHLGLFQETVYYAEQAQKIALVTNAGMSVAQAEVWLSTVWLRAGKQDKAADAVAQARARMPDMERTTRKATLACELAGLYREIHDEEGEQAMLKDAEEIIRYLENRSDTTGSAGSAEAVEATNAGTAKKTRATAGRKPRTAAAAAKTAASTTRKTTATKTTRRTAATAKAAASSVAVAATSSASMDSVSGVENAAIVGLRMNVTIQHVLSLLSQKDWSAALELLRATPWVTGSSTASKARGELLVERVALAACLLGQSTEQMACDAVFSVVQDSTLSFPAISSGSGSGSTGGSSGIAGGDSDRLSLAKPSTTASKGRAAGAKMLKNALAFVDSLQEAQDCLIEAQTMAAVSGDASMLHRISSMLQSAVLVLSATSWGRPRALGHSGFASCSVELARNMTWRRERRALLVEKSSASSSSGSSGSWPILSSGTAHGGSLSGSRRSSLGLSTTGDISRFQRDYIDIIPKEWSVISLALSENQHDLCITRLQAGHSPFVIRLPLERAISRDADTEVFNFQQGRTELLEIVGAINSSCHDARDMTVKGAKATWWSDREALDVRLQELLENVEQIWLGGFRGIFSQHARRPDLFARFQKTFQGILDKHLPSRRIVRNKRGRGATSAAAAATPHKVSLDPRTLGLFIGLGDATVEGCDFDDALNDLLYFVVDILQFHGERNAYDEIDFDSMLIETFDALYSYHAAVHDANAAETSPSNEAEHPHTILVLDKALHVFPWESLPCMQGLAVSRVPSLACLRRLILDQQAIASAAFAEGEAAGNSNRFRYKASAASGAYMLNPGGDLPTTETTFDGPLSSLRSSGASPSGPGSWTRIVGREPTEDEFAAILRDKDVLLYFGHGSGAQYIRGRTVRKLDRCRAATLLMGCSSAGLDYNGEFELHGPVWNYMLAGSPAVVGTLWDVTDKDIDRFAGRAFEEWGLLPAGTFGGGGADGDGTTTTASGKGKGKAAAAAAAAAVARKVTSGQSLVEAIAHARDAPRFRFLTAAAVCVYGIPVYLS